MAFRACWTASKSCQVEFKATPRRGTPFAARGSKRSYEVFVFCALVAHGLLQLIALCFGVEVWQQHHLYLYTRSRDLPSEKTVRQVLAALILKQLLDLSKNSLIAQIRTLFHGAQEEEPADPPSVV